MTAVRTQNSEPLNPEPYPRLSLFIGNDKNECISWLNGKNIKNKFAKNTCNTSIKEWPVSVTSAGK
jgi:hypothetical protein